MSTFRRFLLGALLLASGTFAGCSTSSDHPDRPREARGGFSVLADSPDHPASARVVADIGEFARKRGFVRQAARPGPPVDPVTGESLPAASERYRLGNVELEVSYQPATHRVSAYLHGPDPRQDRRFITRFYADFDQEYRGRYGSEDPISETGYSDEAREPTPPDRPPGASVPGGPVGEPGTGGPAGPGRP